MPIEIERKFLVNGDAWRAGARGKAFRQGYLPAAAGCSVRVRVADDGAWLAIKAATPGLSRAEYEYPIPLDEANELLDTLCHQPVIEKTRYLVEHAGLTWEVDEFAGENAGLVIAELELDSEAQSFEIPDWLGTEVTGDARYYNASLASKPYCSWKST